MSLGLVLSGGGTKGAFEVGALEFLSRNGDFLPKVMTGTSVGALIVGPLAQAQTPQEFQQLVQTVRQNALAVTTMSNVFGRQPWLDQIQGTPLGVFVDELISIRSRPPLPPDPEGVPDPLAIADPPRKHRTLFALSTALSSGPKLIRAGRALREASNSVMNLEPMEAGYRGEEGAHVSRIDEDRITQSGVKLRLTITSMRDGVARYVTEDGTVVADDSVTPYEAAGRPGVITGMMTSSSVPMIFPPRKLGDDVYVDGGIVQNTPLAAAVELGASHIIVIVAGPVPPPQDDTDYTQASLLSIYARAASDIGPSELGKTNLHYPLPHGSSTTMIIPTADVLGGFETEAGLISVDFDYGWMRAAEATADLPDEEKEQLREISDTIALQRERAWFAEDRILQVGPQLHLIGALRRARQHVVAAVTRWCAAGLPAPPEMDRWGHRWEIHNEYIPDDYEVVALP